MLNTLKKNTTKRAAWNEILGLNGTAGTKYWVHDMWTGKELGLFTDYIDIPLAAHDTAALRIRNSDGELSLFADFFFDLRFNLRSNLDYR
jgi:alpha-galactosidase